MSPARSPDAPTKPGASGRGHRGEAEEAPFDLWIEAPPGAPLGSVLLSLASDGALLRVRLEPRRPHRPQAVPPAALREEAREAGDQIRAYLSGRIRRFSLRWRLPAGSSSFTTAVLDVVATIPFGEVLTYGAVAARAGRDIAARAVGGVMGRNPLPLVIPCHRVVGAQGRLGGFTGGLDTKRALLAHEGMTLPAAKGPYR